MSQIKFSKIILAQRRRFEFSTKFSLGGATNKSNLLTANKISFNLKKVKQKREARSPLPKKFNESSG